MRQRVLGTAVSLIALILSFLMGWAAPAAAQAPAGPSADASVLASFGGDDEDCDEDDDDCDDDEDDCESYLNGDEDDDDDGDDDDDEDECDEQDGFIGDSGGTSNPGTDLGANLGTSNNGWLLTFLRNFGLISNQSSGASGLLPIGGVLAGMVIVYATLWRIVRRRFAAR